MRLSKNRFVAVKNRIFVIALVWLGLASSVVGADSRPWVHMAVSGIVKGDSTERVLLCLSAKPRHPDDTIPVTFIYPPRINPYAVVLTPVTVSDFAVVGVWIYWDVNAAPGIGEKLQYVEAKWDTPTPFTFEGRQFVLFASLKSMEYVMEKTYPKRTPPLAR